MKKTEQKALRALPSQKLNPPPNIRLRIIEKMERVVKEALNGSCLNARYLFILNYLSAVVSFHQAVDERTKGQFLIQIGKNEETGYNLGFKREELNSLNFLVLRTKVNGQLTVLERRIKEKSQ